MSAKITLTGQFLNIRSWSFPDESTGEIKSGTTLHITQEQELENRNSDFLGVNISKLTGLKDLFMNVNMNLLGKKVDVICSLKPSSTGFKATPISVQASK